MLWRCREQEEEAAPGFFGRSREGDLAEVQPAAVRILCRTRETASPSAFGCVRFAGSANRTLKSGVEKRKQACNDTDLDAGAIGTGERRADASSNVVPVERACRANECVGAQDAASPASEKPLAQQGRQRDRTEVGCSCAGGLVETTVSH